MRVDTAGRDSGAALPDQLAQLGERVLGVIAERDDPAIDAIELGRRIEVAQRIGGGDALVDE